MLKAWFERVGFMSLIGALRNRGSIDSPKRVGGGSGIKRSRKRSLYAFAGSSIILAGLALFFVRDKLQAPPEHIVLSLSGSTSLGDELMPKLAEFFLRNALRARETGFSVKERDAKGHPHLHVWGKVPGTGVLQVIDISATGSGAAFKCLAAERGPDHCDIGMASRPVNDQDRRLYPAVWNLGDPATEHVVALDGIAIIVNPRNSVSRLSISQLRAIYEGKIRNWREVGGGNSPIELYGRDRDSGTFEIFTERVMGKDSLAIDTAATVPPEHEIGDSGLIVEAVMRSPNAIGYVSSPLIKGAKALMISDGDSPALRPTELAVVTEDYPICRRLLLYDWGEPGSLANSFIRYVTSKPGQAVVAQTPFVGLTPRVFPVVPPQNAPSAYKRIALKYSRIGLSFHYSSAQTVAEEDGNGQLDNLARVNVLRLRTFLAQHNGTGDDTLLIGFADEVEGRTPGEHLARQRAEAVATELRSIGIIVPSENIRDFGSELPVASNDISEGRSKNRRVEVWVRNGIL